MSDTGRPPHLPDEALVDVVHGLVPHDERSRWLAHIKACPECERRFLETWRDREIGRLCPPPSVVNQRRAWVFGPLAVAAAVILLLAFLLPPGTDPLLTPDWLALDATESFARGPGSCDHDVPVEEAVAAYRSRDAARVVRLLSGHELQTGCDPLRLVLASALLHAGDAAGALRVLDALDVESLPQPARDRGRWIRALALDRLGRRQETMEALEQLASGSGEFREKASAALRTSRR